MVHEPGGMNRNLCVIEVKQHSGLAKGFRKDLNPKSPLNNRTPDW